MSKELLINIKPEHLVDILNGKKTLELRKTVPKHYKGWVNIYCTKSSKNILYKYKDIYYTQHYLTFTDDVDILNGKVVARFWFDEYEILEYIHEWGESDYLIKVEYRDGTIPINQFWYIDSNYLDSICLDYQDILDYGFIEKPKRHQKNLYANLYAWHIKELEIFDEPKELSEFYVHSKSFYIADKYGYENEELINYVKLIKAPQSYQFVYVKENLK